LAVARFERENNVDLIVDGFRHSASALPLVVVGGAPYASEYVQRITDLAASDPRIRLVGPIYDQVLLNQLYCHALTYIHGHSVGGTNPSLLRAMGAGAAVNAIDVSFTREVLGDTGRFFSTPDDLAVLTEQAEADVAASIERGRESQARARATYDWDVVACDYERLCQRLSGALETVDLRQRRETNLSDRRHETAETSDSHA
jgi:glycosyltransferase involved in cell wall biosynthesis